MCNNDVSNPPKQKTARKKIPISDQLRINLFVSSQIESDQKLQRWRTVFRLVFQLMPMLIVRKAARFHSAFFGSKILFYGTTQESGWSAWIFEKFKNYQNKIFQNLSWWQKNMQSESFS